jgi:hypothetical protein
MNKNLRNVSSLLGVPWMRGKLSIQCYYKAHLSPVRFAAVMRVTTSESVGTVVSSLLTTQSLSYDSAELDRHGSQFWSRLKTGPTRSVNDTCGCTVLVPTGLFSIHIQKESTMHRHSKPDKELVVWVDNSVDASTELFTIDEAA